MSVAPWVVLRGDSRIAVACECTRCGQRHERALPLTIDAFTRWVQAAQEIHRGCKEASS